MLQKLRRFSARKLWNAIDIEKGPSIQEWFWGKVLRALYPGTRQFPYKEL